MLYRRSTTLECLLCCEHRLSELIKKFFVVSTVQSQCSHATWTQNVSHRETYTHRSDSSIEQYFWVVVASLFGATFVGETIHNLVRNRGFVRGLPRARVVERSNIVRLTVNVPTTLSPYPGQYINVWMPGVSFWSFLQNHPFVVASAQHDKGGTTLELVVEARRGWTAKLFQPRHRGRNERSQTGTYICLFSGPHGRGEDVDTYGTVVLVVLVASGWGLVGLLPYLQHLIQGYNAHTTNARRIHLIWQLHDVGKSRQIRSRYDLTDEVDDGRPVADLLDRALLQDKMDSAYVSAYRFRFQLRFIDGDRF